MLDIRDSFNVMIGLSDHTLGTATSITAITMGACMIEKHFTMDRKDGGPDSHFSLEPDELKTLCTDTRYTYEHLGDGLEKIIDDLGQDIKWARDSIGGIKYGGDTKLKKKGIFTRQFYSLTDIKPGETLVLNDNVRSIRAPADSGGISPKYFRKVLGEKAQDSIPRHTAIKPTAVGL